MNNICKILVLSVMAFCLTSCGIKNADIINDSEEDHISEENQNSEYDHLNSLFIYTNVDTKTMRVDSLPNTSDAEYQLLLDRTNKLCSFHYYGEMKKKYGRNMRDAVEGASFSDEVFYEIKEMIYKNKLEQYEFTFDENQMKVDTIEPYVICIVYDIDGIHHIMEIKTPENIDEIIAKLNELVSISGTHLIEGH